MFGISECIGGWVKVHILGVPIHSFLKLWINIFQTIWIKWRFWVIHFPKSIGIIKLFGDFKTIFTNSYWWVIKSVHLGRRNSTIRHFHLRKMMITHLRIIECWTSLEKVIVNIIIKIAFQEWIISLTINSTFRDLFLSWWNLRIRWYHTLRVNILT